jgi:ABC-2 type transport system permease protein
MFPILLTTCLYLAAGKIGTVNTFETIKIAYDNQGVQTDEFGSVLQSAKLSDDKMMFDITLCSREEAKELLDKGTIEAYIIGSSKPELFVKENGLNETIVKAFLDSYRQMQITIGNILAQNPKAINNGLIDDVMNYENFISEAKNQKKPDSILIFFYAIMAFTCVFAANWGLDEVINIQADQSLCGARVNVSPVNKMKLFLCNMLAAFTCHIISVILLFLYMNYVLNINFGDNLIYLLSICFLGSLAGLVLGANIGLWVKKKAEVKGAILTAVVMGGGFLSGMMMAEVKYYVAEKFPLLAYINPVNLVTDAMYSLYYFDTYKRFYLDVVLLFIIMAVLMAASYLGIRRKNYASI